MASDTRKAPKLQTVLRTPADQSESCRCSSGLHTLLSFGFPAQPSGALQHEEIVDVELVDNSMITDDKLATIVVNVIGASKIEQL